MILEDGALATVDADGDSGGNIQVIADGRLLARNWWVIVLPGI